MEYREVKTDFKLHKTEMSIYMVYNLEAKASYIKMILFSFL